jgi:hypothetical protein
VTAGVQQLRCKAFACGKKFVPTVEDIRSGHPSLRGEWVFLAICPHCKVLFDYHVSAKGEDGCPVG